MTLPIATPVGAAVDPRVALNLQKLSARFTILGLIGEGGTAFVYQAIDRPSGRSVAIKLMHPNLLHEPTARAAFVREAELMESLTHQSIVSVLEVIQLEALGCAIVMPYVDGFTLKQQVRAAGAMPFMTIRSILGDLLSALEYAHGVGIVHRDIKPHNIFLDSATSRALLGDFGIAARLDEQVSPDSPDNMGTPQYMSPEHIDGRVTDRRSDIYSIGCVLYEMITGLEPWGGLSLSEVLQRQRNSALPDPLSVRPDLPADLSRILSRALSKDPRQRWQTAGEMAAALDPSPIPMWARAYNPRVKEKPVGISIPNPLATRFGAVNIAIGLGVVLLGVGAVQLMLSSGTVEQSSPIIETRVDPSLIGTGEPVFVERPLTQTLEDAQDPQQAPPPQPLPQDPAPVPVVYVQDDDARSLLGQATQVSGSGSGYELIDGLRSLAQSSQVSPALRERLQVAAQDLAKQCVGAQLLDPSVRCP